MYLQRQIEGTHGAVRRAHVVQSDCYHEVVRAQLFLSHYKASLIVLQRFDLLVHFLQTHAHLQIARGDTTSVFLLVEGVVDDETGTVLIQGRLDP